MNLPAGQFGDRWPNGGHYLQLLFQPAMNFQNS